MLGRMFGALRLNAATYEDVEHDKRAIYQALFIVIYGICRHRWR